MGTSGGAGNKIVIGIMGVNVRGMAHIENFLALPNTEIA
jgi:hypothetical protein